jgi:Flp pilus assembly protein TadG
MSSHAFSRTALPRLLEDRRGVTALEFGFVGMIFLTLLLGAVELGRYQFTVQSLREFSAAAARTALINANQVAALQASGSTTASRMADSAIKAAVITPTNPTPLLTPASLTLTSAWATNASGVQTVTVTVSYPFRFVAPLLPGGALTLTDRSALSF